MNTLREGDAGEEVTRLQRRLKELGFDPGKIDGDFGPGTEAAVLAFQKSEGLLADGVAGPRTLRELGLLTGAVTNSVTRQVTVSVVSKMFPSTPLGNIAKHLPAVLTALEDADLADKPMVLMALATIRAESEGFEPISEFKSRFNTSPGGHPFDLYDHRKDLGNQGPPDGKNFRGRGFIQLTGRANYKEHGQGIGLKQGLLTDPDRANDSAIAAKLLAHFLKSKERQIKEALLEDNLRSARRRVNGGSHGLDRFTDAFRRGQKLIA